MSLSSFLVVLLTLAGLFSYPNTRFFRPPAGILLLLLGALLATYGLLAAAATPRIFGPLAFAVVLFSAGAQGLTLKRLLTFLRRPVA